MKTLKLVTASEAEKERRKLKSYWSKETQISQRVLIRCLDLLEQIEQNTRRRSRKRRKPMTPRQKFVSAKLRRGLSLKQISELWRGMADQAKAS